MRTSLIKPSIWQIAFALLIGVFGISMAAVFVRLSSQKTGLNGIGFSLFLSASRLIVSSLLIFPLWKGLSQVKAQPGAFVYSVIAGICLAIHYVAWFLSLSYTSIAASVTIVTTNPIWVTLLYWILFKQKPMRQTLLGIFLALLGALIIAYDGAITESIIADNPLLGNFLALIGSWVYSLYFLAGKEAQNKGLSTGIYAVIAYSSAGLVLLPLPYFFGSGYTGYPTIVYLYIFLMAVFSQVIGQTSLNWSLRWISPIIVTLAVMFEPVFSKYIRLHIFWRDT
ncbi:DMT family transporter [Nostoc sp. WHI]|uniref:DMT family transporter n=1 Tax=Nostoc sp. WHI TaxID=2650611 RepID=UPI0018C7D12D|nr:DMT family transporter [Nostoc sp. WHI]